MVDLATKEMRKRMAKTILTAGGLVVLISAALIWWFFTANISVVTIRGESMEPTFQNGQTIALKHAPAAEIGMIVVFHRPASWGETTDKAQELIKRIVAVGGSTVEYDGSVFRVDGQVSYNLKNDGYSCSLEPGYTHVLASNEILAFGDNHKNSMDSLRVLCDGDPANAYIPLEETVAYGNVEGKL